MQNRKMKLLAALSVYTFFCLLLPEGDSAPHDVQEKNVPHHGQPKPRNDYMEEIHRENQRLFLSNYLIDYAHLHGGLLIDLKNPNQFVKDAEGNPILNAKRLSNHFSETMPMTLFPSPFPDELFAQVKKLHPVMAELHLRVSRDYTFLKQVMDPVGKADPPFIGELVKIMDAAANHRHRQSGLTLIIERSDYLTHLETTGGKTAIKLKQIEATGGNNAGQGDFQLASKFHQRMLDKLRYMNNDPSALHGLNVQENDSLEGQAAALFETWLRFAEMHGKYDAVILLISANKRRYHTHYEKLNVNQYTLEDIAEEYMEKRRKIHDNREYKPHLVQITIEECAKRLYVQQDHHLILKDEMGANRHVALAYFMDGYLPEHFQPEDKGLNLYKIRQEMELSEAVIQPNIFIFFAGTKTVQQALTEPNVMESFFPEAANDHELESTLAQLRDTFIEQWRLSPAVTKMASEHAHLYVLKSNRQGGKGVLFGKDIQEELQKLASEPEEQKNEYILQKLVDPFYAKNIVLPEPPQPETDLNVVEVNSEVSVFGALLARTVPQGMASRKRKVAAQHPSPEDMAAKKVHLQKEHVATGEKPSLALRVVAAMVAERISEDENAGKLAKNSGNMSPRGVGGGHHAQQRVGRAAGSGNTSPELPHGMIQSVRRDSPALKFPVDQQIILNNDQDIIFNTVDGYGVRTKILNTKTCTISGGAGGMDSIVLFPEQKFLPKSRSEAAAAKTAAQGEASCANAAGEFSIEEEPMEVKDNL